VRTSSVACNPLGRISQARSENKLLAFLRGLSFAALLVATTPALPAAEAPYPHAAEPIGTVRQIYDGVLTPEMAVNTFRNIDRLFPVRKVPRSSQPAPLPQAATPLKTLRFSDEGKQYSLDDYLKLNRVTGLLVLHEGRIKMERYLHGNSERTRWMSMSIAKSITSTLIGAAVEEGKITSITDLVTRYVPALKDSAYEGVSVRDVLMMSSGARWTETYTNPASDRRRLLEAQIAQKPGGALAVMKSLPRAAPPGSVNNYNTGETQVAAEILRSATGKPLADYLHERIWNRIDAEADADWWLESPDGIEIGGSGFSATLRDYGRFGLFLLNQGRIGNTAILPAGWVSEATTPRQLRNGKLLDYGYLWWTGTSPAARKDNSFSAEGIHGQYLYINPATRVVIVVWSAQPIPLGGAVVNDWAFFDAASEALR